MVSRQEHLNFATNVHFYVSKGNMGNLTFESYITIYSNKRYQDCFGLRYATPPIIILCPYIFNTCRVVRFPLEANILGL